MGGAGIEGPDCIRSIVPRMRGQQAARGGIGSGQQHIAPVRRRPNAKEVEESGFASRVWQWRALVDGSVHARDPSVFPVQVEMAVNFAQVSGILALPSPPAVRGLV